MQLLSEVLRESADKNGLKKTLEAEKIISSWSAIVGEEIAKKAQPTMLRNKTLIVATSSPSWSHQLMMLKPQLLKKIRDTGEEIDEIIFRAASAPKKKSETKKLLPITSPPDYTGLPVETKKGLREAMASFMGAKHTKKR